MNDVQQRDLEDLRRAAHRRDQEQLQYLLKRLLQQVDYYVALSVVVERVYSLIDIFESYYPDETWVRQLLVGIASFGMPPDDSVAEMALNQQFSAPGMGNYIKAIYDVTQAMQKKHTGEARVGFMTSAVVNAIMAELAETWYGEREDSWERVRTNHYDPASGQYSDAEALQIAYEFWTDEETAALDTACWREIADAVERALHR